MEALEAGIARIQVTRDTRKLGLELLRAAPRQVKLMVLEQVARELLDPLFTSHGTKRRPS